MDVFLSFQTVAPGIIHYLDATNRTLPCIIKTLIPCPKGLPMKIPISRTMMWRALLVAAAMFLYFSGLGAHGLLEPDEGRYSEITREMLESGDFVTPRLNYVKYFEKPVLTYWLTAGSMAVLGQTEFAARLLPALAALGCALTVWILSRRMFGPNDAFFSAAILLTSLLHFVLGRIHITDMPLSLFITLAMAGLWFGLEKDRRFLLVFHGGMALALLTKGLVGIVLPGGILLCFVILTRRWNLFRRVFYLPGILLFFAVSIPWFAEVCRRNSDFFSFFFIREHFLRYATKMHERYEPGWYFIPFLFMGFVPWSGLVPAGLKSVLPSSLRNFVLEKRKELFLLLWAGVIFLFFSFSGSKLIPYILPVFPPLSMLMGNRLARFAEGKNPGEAKWFFILTALFLIPFAAALAAYPFLGGRDIPGMAFRSLPPAAALLAFLSGGWILHRQRKFMAAAIFLCLMAFASMFAFQPGMAFYEGLRSTRELASVIGEIRRDGDVVVQYEGYDQGLPFYLKQRIVLVNYLGELEFGASQEKDPSWFVNDEGLKRLWGEERRVLLVIGRNRLEKVSGLLGPGLPSIAGKTSRRLVLVNRP